jgi:hypothetical protein
MGRFLIIGGLAVAAIGAVLTWAPWLVSWFGRLPGDIRVEREHGAFYFPIVSLIIVNLLFALISRLVSR